MKKLLNGTKAIALDDYSEDVYENLGKAYQYLGKEEKANECFQKSYMIRHMIKFVEFPT